MNPILVWGINLIVAIQHGAPWLQAPAQFFSFLGNEEFFFLVLPLLYWCIDVRLGVRVAIILTLSNSINHFFKLAFHQPRPFWVSTQVQPGVQETSYGLPSGHAQHAATVWGTIGSVGKTWLRWLMAAIILLIGLSRIVLAVHFPSDVLLGWIIGGLVLWAFLKWEAPGLAWFNRLTLARKIGLALAASMLIWIVALAGLAFVPPSDPPEWESTAARFFPPEAGQTAIDPRDSGGPIGAAGTFFGLVAGAVLLFHTHSFDPRVAVWKRVARGVIGILGVAVLWLGLRMVFPRDTALVSQVLRFARYAITGVWVAYGAPRLFLKLGL